MDVKQEVVVSCPANSAVIRKYLLCSRAQFSTSVYSTSVSVQLQGSEPFYFL